MKKLIASSIVLALLLSLTGCGLFADSSVLKLGDYTYSDPKDLKYDERVALGNESFTSDLQEMANAAAYPDNMMYNEDGDVVGMYDYDPETGLAVGWTNLEDGAYTAYEPGEEVDLGKPDASSLVEIPGNVALYCVVYGSNGSVNDAWMYLMLSDASAKDAVISTMSDTYGVDLTAESDTVLKAELDADLYADMDVQSFTEVLMQYFGVTTIGGVNPYEPYAGHEDPTDVDYDQRVVLTGSGTAAVDEDMESDVSSMTDYIYGKDGKVVAQYTYFECPSKEAADKVEEFYASADGMTRVSDTVVGIFHTGQGMQDILTTYQGYNVLKDDSVDEYVRMTQETYFSSVYE